MISNSDFLNKGSYIVNKIGIKNIPDYITYINFLQKKWGHNELWYRGVNDLSHKLVPKIYRPEIWRYNKENAYNLFNLFIGRGKQLITGDYDEWQWYQIQQHYGLPTRLLDWTEGYLIALFFALRNNVENSSPCVWVLDPFQLNLISVNKRKLFYTDPIIRDEEDSIIDKYLFDKVELSHLNDEVELPHLPIALLPPYIDNRIKSQRSCFTIHGFAHDGFHQVYFENKEDFKLAQLHISLSETGTIKSELISAGISESTLFPDLEGLAREIKDKFAMK